ncbi:hypothetical protein MRX96_004089 [Rhipicephalus microplus]
MPFMMFPVILSPRGNGVAGDVVQLHRKLEPQRSGVCGTATNDSSGGAQILRGKNSEGLSSRFLRAEAASSPIFHEVPAKEKHRAEVRPRRGTDRKPANTPVGGGPLRALL